MQRWNALSIRVQDCSQRAKALVWIHLPNTILVDQHASYAPVDKLTAEAQDLPKTEAVDVRVGLHHLKSEGGHWMVRVQVALLANLTLEPAPGRRARTAAVFGGRNRRRTRTPPVSLKKSTTVCTSDRGPSDLLALLLKYWANLAGRQLSLCVCVMLGRGKPDVPDVASHDHEAQLLFAW